jgi:hypothetical protein
MEPNPGSAANADLEALRVAKPAGTGHYRTSERDCEWSWRTSPHSRDVGSNEFFADPPFDSPRPGRPRQYPQNQLRSALPNADDTADIEPGDRLFPVRCNDNGDWLPAVANAEPLLGNGHCNSN